MEWLMGLLARQLGVGSLQIHGLASNYGPVFAPVELERLPRRKHQIGVQLLHRATLVARLASSDPQPVRQVFSKRGGLAGTLKVIGISS